MALQENFELEGNWLFRYRGILPLVILGAGMAVCLFTIRTSGWLFTAVSSYWQRYEYLCLAISLLGVFIRAYTVGHTPVGTFGRNTQSQVAEELNTTGIYSMVRHPLYVGNSFMWFGISLLTCNVAFIIIFMLVYWLYYERIMFAEEQFLRRKFGECYLRWADKTPTFIPCFRKFVPSALSFSWKKVIKKEKNGWFALLLIFCIFDGIAVWQLGFHCNVILLALAIVSGVVYLALKYLKKYTKLLDEQGR